MKKPELFCCGSAEAVTRVLINLFPFGWHFKTDHTVHCCVSSWTVSRTM